MISILGCPWLPLPPCLPSSSPFMISILGCSWLPLPPCPPSFVFQPCLCSLLPLPPRLPSLFFGNAIWGLCRYNYRDDLKVFLGRKRSLFSFLLGLEDCLCGLSRVTSAQSSDARNYFYWPFENTDNAVCPTTSRCVKTPSDSNGLSFLNQNQNGN